MRDVKFRGIKKLTAHIGGGAAADKSIAADLENTRARRAVTLIEALRARADLTTIGMAANKATRAHTLAKVVGSWRAGPFLRGRSRRSRRRRRGVGVGLLLAVAVEAARIEGVAADESITGAFVVFAQIEGLSSNAAGLGVRAESVAVADDIIRPSRSAAANIARRADARGEVDAALTCAHGISSALENGELRGGCQRGRGAESEEGEGGGEDGDD
jgi:hypothetical protein